MVPPARIELATPCSSDRCSTTELQRLGESRRSQTSNVLVKSQLLYQLSYRPMAEGRGVEPLRPIKLAWFQSRCRRRLSARPSIKLLNGGECRIRTYGTRRHTELATQSNKPLCQLTLVNDLGLEPRYQGLKGPCWSNLASRPWCDRGISKSQFLFGRETVCL